MPSEKSNSPAEQKKKGNRSKGGQPLSPKPNTIVVGDELEYRIQRLMIYMGYSCRRSRPIYTVAKLDQATDLDVFSIRWKEPFRREIVIAECKGGGNKPLDRIFWLTGVQKYVNADEALLVRHGTKWNIKDFAKQCGVQVIDIHRIAEIEKNYAIGVEDWPGLSDINFARTTVNEWNDTIAKDQGIWELYWTLISEVRFDEPFAIINYLLPNLRRLTSLNRTNPTNSFYRFLFTEAICNIALCIMQLAEGSFDLTPKDREGFLKKGFTYGNIEPAFADRILKSSFNLAKQAVLHYTSQNVEIDKSIFEMPTPPGSNEIISIINHLINNYPHSLKFPQVCDVILSEIFLKQNKPKGILRKIYPYIEISPAFGIVMRFLSVLSKIKACPEYIIDSVSLSPEENKKQMKLSI